MCYFDFYENEKPKQVRALPVPMNGKSVTECVLLDWDGTLLDSFKADAQAYIDMFAAMGLPWSVVELKRHDSPNWHRVYRAARLPRAKWDEADRLWMKFYRTHRPEVQPGARLGLCTLDRRFTLSLLSSGRRARGRRPLRGPGRAAIAPTRSFTHHAPRPKPPPAAPPH